MNWEIEGKYGHRRLLLIFCLFVIHSKFILAVLILLIARALLLVVKVDEGKRREKGER